MLIYVKITILFGYIYINMYICIYKNNLILFVMKYYLNGWHWSNEITKEKFYSLRRSSKWHETVSLNCGFVVARKLTLINR